MSSGKRQFFSFLTIVVFMLMAIASKVGDVQKSMFSYGTHEETVGKGNYIEKNDGTKIYGNNISWKSGAAVKDVITLDDTKYKIEDIKGFLRGGDYMIRFGNEYIQRVVRGKINVYAQIEEVVVISNNGRGGTTTNHATKTNYYYQMGDDGELKKFDGKNDIARIVHDCPTALAMADISNKQFEKEIENDPSYANRIFDIYNNGCK